MITIMETKKIVNNKELVDIACLSTDTKPTTGIMNGSMLIETDTGKVCIYNEADGEWTEIGSGGGGGGSSDFTTAEVEFTVTGGEAVSMGFVCIDNDSIRTDGAVVAGTFTLPLYKGSLTMSLLEQATVTITGSATYNEDDGFIIITGDCSIALDITK